MQLNDVPDGIRKLLEGVERLGTSQYATLQDWLGRVYREPKAVVWALEQFDREIVGQIAAALGAEKLIFLTDVAGILDGSKKLIPKMSVPEAKAMLASGVASGGMIPKIEACLVALPAVRVTRIIDGRVPHALIKEVEGGMEGTTIT